MKSDSIQVSLVVTFHGEGAIASKSLAGIARCRNHARRSGIDCEIVAVADRADRVTLSSLAEANLLEDSDQLIEVSVGDVGLARNAGVSISRGEWISISDGDDYLGEAWISRAFAKAAGKSRRHVFHPEWVAYFGQQMSIWRQIGSDHPDFDAGILLVANPWNACSFAHATVREEHPYIGVSRLPDGFGFEDWHWHCQTLAHGCTHSIVEDTLHLVRIKSHGSLNESHRSRNAIIPRTDLFLPPFDRIAHA